MATLVQPLEGLLVDSPFLGVRLDVTTCFSSRSELQLGTMLMAQIGAGPSGISVSASDSPRQRTSSPFPCSTCVVELRLRNTPSWSLPLFSLALITR